MDATKVLGGNAPHHQALKPLAACLALALGVSATSHATTRLVTDCTDGAGLGTLRNTVAAAISGDVVKIPSSCSTITMTTGAGPILIEQLDGISITGPGASALTIKASSSSPYSRVFLDSGGPLTLSGMTITGGKYVGEAVPAGGCIFSISDVTLEDSVVSGCFLTTEQGATNYSKGGAIYAKGNVTLTNTYVENNFASTLVRASGGGIYAQGSVYLTHSVVSGNSATSGAGFGASGGGIYAKQGLMAAYSSITNNYANAGLGGVSSGGGAFLRGGGNASIQYSTISGNYAMSGSGLFVDTLYNITVSIENSTISDNFGVGAAVSSQAQTTIISNSTIAFNRATDDYVAGVFSEESITIQSSILPTISEDSMCGHLLAA